MNEIISYSETKYIKRRIAQKIKGMVDTFAVTVLTGARQVGKSTLLQHEFPDFRYLTLDDFSLREQILLDPHSLWKGTDRLIIDEAQKQPGVFEAIKTAVDSSGRRKKFILSGSANLLLMEKVTESLAGRAGYCELLPMTNGETEGFAGAANFNLLWKSEPMVREGAIGAVDSRQLILRGFMPPVLGLASHGAVLGWLDGYVRTYLERDLRELSQVESLVDFRRVMQMLALRSGNILNQADIAKESATSHATAHRYIRLLEVSNLFTRVPAFSVNRTKRLVKSPKIFCVDPGLAVFLAGYFDPESLGRCRELGGFFETLVYLHLLACCEAMTPRARLHYWRTVAGREVDFVVEHGRRLLAVEVKYTANPTVRDIKNLLLFLEEYPDTVCGVLVHAGESIAWLHSRVIAVPWWWLDR
jgi:hypothetical protein